MKYCLSLWSTKAAVEKEFEEKIKCLRSNNGGEYMSHDFFQRQKMNAHIKTFQEKKMVNKKQSERQQERKSGQAISKIIR